MEDLILELENGNSEKAIQLINDKNLFLEKDSDGWNLIQLASYYNNTLVFEYLLDQLPNDYINSQQKHPILIALENNNKEIINKILELDPKSFYWDYKTKSNENLLILSIYFKNSNLTNFLLEKNISCFEKTNNFTTAFSLVVDSGDTVLFDKLDQHNQLADNYNEIFIKKSINNDFVEIFDRLKPYSDLTNDQLFSLASDFDSIKIINSIVQSGDFMPGTEQISTIINLISKTYNNSDDKKACLELVDFLFNIKIPFSKFCNSYGQSAWMLCILNNNTEVFERLMQGTDNVSVTDNDLQSPLFYAIEKNNLSFVNLLLKKNANVNLIDKNKNTPLIKAVQKGNIDIVTAISKYSTNINHVNSDNDHALSLAIKKRRFDIVDNLIWAGGEITTNPVKIVDEKNIFHFGFDGQSSHFNNFDVEEIDNFVSLSKLGFNLNKINDEGDTLLLHFIKNGYISNFSAMMKCNVNPNQKDIEDNDALMCAARKKTDEYFNSIIRRFSNLNYNQKNTSGDNVYDICLKSNNINRIETLVLTDNNLTKDNAEKSIKVISKYAKLENFKDSFNRINFDYSFKDLNDNNLLMFSIAGANFDNFKFLINEAKITFSISDKNKNGHTILDMIDALPEEEKNNFTVFLTQTLKKKIIKF